MAEGRALLRARQFFGPRDRSADGHSERSVTDEPRAGRHRELRGENRPPGIQVRAGQVEAPQACGAAGQDGASSTGAGEVLEGDPDSAIGFGITREQAGGSPTGEPTKPPVSLIDFEQA
mgnify:CR=1 FL=1